MWGCSPKVKENSSSYDVTFKFKNSSFSCEKAIFSAASSTLKRIFDIAESGLPDKYSLCTSVKVCPCSGAITIDLDEPFEAFHAIHKYLHNPRFQIDLSLLPSVCMIAKKYRFTDVWCTYSSLLAKSISLENIGEVCPLVYLSNDQTKGSEDATTQQLTSAVREFLISNADAIASSQTGQLSARLFIDVLESPQNHCHDSYTDVRPANDNEDWGLSERVLFYCSRRVQDREPLDEGNCITYEDNAVRKLNNEIYASASDTVTDEIRMTIPDTQLVNFGISTSSQLSLSTSETGEQVKIAVARQMSTGSEVVAETPSSSTQSISPLPSSNRSSCPADKETCLVAKTSLGIGSISIHLGKLEGRLVSISVKRRRAPSGPGSSASSSVAGGGGLTCPPVSPLTASVILPPSPPSLATAATTIVIPSTPSTQEDQCLNEGSPNAAYRRGSVLCSLGCLSTPLLESRSTAGACTICSMIEEGEDEAGPIMSHFILIAGGTSHNRCLNSTEILRISRLNGEVDGSTDQRASMLSANSDFDSVSNFGTWSSVRLTAQPGPPMHSPRGRLGLAALKGASCIYACGGCDGNDDLATVECLSFDTKDEYQRKWRFVSSMQQERSCCAVATWVDESRIVVMGGQCGGSPLSSVEVYYADSDKWLSLPPLSEARSQLCAATLSQRNLIVAVGGVSETPDTPSTRPSNPSTQNFIDPSELSPSGEACDLRCPQWIRLPELLNRGPLIGAALVPLSPSSGRLLLIGGSDGLSTMTQTQIFDSRAWSWLPGPSLSIGRASPCAVSLTPPPTQPVSTLTPAAPYIAVIGGYNIAAGGFLNSVEIVGVAGISGKISPFIVPSSVSTKVPASTIAPEPSSDVPMTSGIPPDHETSPPGIPPARPPSRLEKEQDCSLVGVLSTK